MNQESKMEKIKISPKQILILYLITKIK